MVYRFHAEVKGDSAEAEEFLAQWRDYSKGTITAHTSGSTGAPKSIELSKQDMMKSACATIDRFGLNDSSTLLLPLSPQYIAGKMMLVRAEIAHCNIVVEKPSNNPLKEDYGRIDLMAVVPSQCEALIHNEHAHQCLKNLIIGGAPLSSEMELRLCDKKTYWHSYVSYGMTETCSHVALREVGEPFYRAMPGITFSTDQRQCLVIEAPGYSFNKLITNDVVKLIDENCFKWLGRADNTINSGGIKLQPEELEQQLSHDITTPYYIDGVEHPLWGTAVRITVEDNGLITEGQIADICTKRLPGYARPKEIRIVASIPRTSSGKILRR